MVYQDKPIGQFSMDNLSLRFSSHLILGCVKLTIKVVIVVPNLDSLAYYENFQYEPNFLLQVVFLWCPSTVT